MGWHTVDRSIDSRRKAVVAHVAAAALLVCGVTPVAPVRPAQRSRATVTATRPVPRQAADDALRVGRASRSANRSGVTAVTSPPPPTRDQLIATVIAWAMAQRGKAYVFGAAGPDAYDCSGLTMRAYEQVGIRFGHWTGWQLQVGRPVSRSAMLPGDLVFPLWDHVGIYLGNDLMIVAPTEGEPVQVQRVWSFYAARRIIG